MTKKTKKILIISGSSLLALILLLVGLRALFSGKSKNNTTYVARKERYENVIDISGTVAAAQEQTLQALSSGTVTEVYVKAGDKVKKGDIILQLDDTEQVYNLEKQEYNMAQKRVSGSQRELKLMETERHSLMRKVEDRKIIANFDGIIADLEVSVGDSLNAKDIVGTIVNVDYLTTEVEVTETDVSKLKVGQEVIFSFPAYPKGKVKGYVTGWPAIGEVTSRGATVVKAKIRIDDYPEEILPNYSFTGKIQISPLEDNIIVEKYAIGYDENKQPYVVNAKNGNKISVTVEPYGREFVKVKSGLEGGEILKQLTEPKFSGKAGMMMPPSSSKKSGGKR